MNDGPLQALVSTGLILAVMAAVVIAFRLWIRKPANASGHDPPGVRTIVTFAGEDPAFVTEDRDGEPYIGIRLFRMLCDGLTSRRIRVENQATVQYAQAAECSLGDTRYALVLEWFDGLWLVSVEWLPLRNAERRHLALTYQVFAPPDSSELRQLLRALDDWLKSEPGITDVRWFRRERWGEEDTSDPSPTPEESQESRVKS